MKPFTMSLLFAASSYSFPQGYGGPSAQPVGQDQLGLVDGATAGLKCLLVTPSSKNTVSFDAIFLYLK